MAASFLGSLLVKIKGDNSDLDKSLDGSEKKTKAFSKIAIASYAAIGVAIIALSKKYVKAFAVQEKAETALRSAIKATGKESTISVNKLKAYASSLQEVTLFGDEAILSGQALLQSLADLNEKGLKDITPAVLDFAQATGMDLTAAMSLVGKTLGSSTNALARYGIDIDTSASKSEKLAQLTTVLGQKFGGAAEAAGNMATGDLIQLDNAFGDVSESLGGLITDGINPFVTGLIPIVSGLASWITQQREVNKLIEDAKDGVLDNDTSIETMRESLEKLNKQYEQSKNGIRGGNDALKDSIAFLNQQIGFKQQQIAMEGRYGKSIEERNEKERVAEEEAKVREEERLIREQEDLIIRDENWNKFFNNRKTEGDLFRDALDERDAREKASAEAEVILQGIRLEAAATFFNGFAALADLGASKSLGLAIAFKALASAEAGINSYLAYTKALATVPFPWSIAAGAGILAKGIAAQAKIIATPVMLAEGGVLQPTSGGTPAIMAEAGVPEMAAPLTSKALNPFADMIASRITNNNTTNNTQNFNSMFSLSDDNKKRQVARELFPFFEDEKQRRGM